MRRVATYSQYLARLEKKQQGGGSGRDTNPRVDDVDTNLTLTLNPKPPRINHPYVAYI